MRPAAFLDRDGTIIDDAHYLADAARVRVRPGAIDAVRRLHTAQVVPIVVTNQSGIAQGLITEAAYAAVRTRIDALFEQAGAPLTAQYHCPHYPSVSGPCRCRKPGTGLFRDAAAEHQLDVTRSMFVGDRRRDVEPALSLKGWGILVPSDETAESDVLWAEQHANVADSLEEAVIRYLAWLQG